MTKLHAGKWNCHVILLMLCIEKESSMFQLIPSHEYIAPWCLLSHLFAFIKDCVIQVLLE